MVLPLGDVERTRIVPVATYLLIAINIAMFCVELDQGKNFQVSYSATPYEITHAEDIVKPVPVLLEGEGVNGETMIEHGPIPFSVYLTLITSMFLHASPLHLAFNMLFLWIFGDNVEEVLGSFRYVIAYLACGMVGTLAQIVVMPDSHINILGASGAIAGVMGSYLIWYPYNRVRVLFFNFLTEMPAFLVIGIWILLQIGMSLGSIHQIGEVGGVAYLAHVGGATFGLIVGFLFRNQAIRVQAEAYREAWAEYDRV
jgi:membrane associated rhomboid family serine protease